MYENLYENIIDAIVEKGYIVIENVLSKESLTSLVKEASKESLYKKAGISSSTKLHLDENRRRDKIVWLDNDNERDKLYLDFTQGLRESLNRSLYLGQSYYEAHYALYEKDAFYEKHLDAFRGSKNRAVTTVFYLNEGWRDGDGGELLIYDEDDNLITQVKPTANTLVVFLSDKFPHEVLAANKIRYSIAGWFRVDKRDD